VYALGCVTYEMLVGDPPFTGSTAQAIVAKVMTEKPGPPSRLRDTIPPPVEDAVLTALEKLPADRFATAAEFAAALGGGATVRTTTRAQQRAVADPGPWRRISIALGALLLGALALAAWALGREPAASGPEVFDVALPEDAAISLGAATASTSFGTPLRNLSVASDGSFTVYAARQGDSTMLWRRSLRDASARVIDGTRGAIAPRISPDGSRVAFLVGGRVMVLPIEGGNAELLLDGADPRTLEWISPTALLLIDYEGSRLSWLDREGSQRPRSIVTTALGYGHWIPEDRQVISSRNGTALIMDPETGETWPVRSTLPDGSPGSVLSGSAFRVVQGEFLVYISDGDLRAAAYDRARHLAGRPTTLVSGIRRESTGAAQFDVTESGDLVYAPGADATVGHIVRLRPGGEPEPLPLDSAEIQRFDLSPDGRWLAVVVVTAGGHEVRIHDLRDGQRINWLRAELIRHALWSPDGQRLLVGLRDSTRWSLLSGIPSTGMLPDTLYSSGLENAFDPLDYRASDAVVAQNWTTYAAVRFDPGAEPVRFDTMATKVRFASLSPDRTRMMYTEESGRVVVASYPTGRRWQVAADGAEPLWMSATEILFRRGVSWYLARLDPVSGEPVGAPTLWGRDPRFSDTAGWSNRPSHDGGIIYLQGPEQVSGTYLRVIPNWVAGMKSAVDQSNP
jgi:serine/threonine-protein kinase